MERKQTGWISENTYKAERGVRYFARENTVGCAGCDFTPLSELCISAKCHPDDRKDKKSVCFKKQKKGAK